MKSTGQGKKINKTNKANKNAIRQEIPQNIIHLETSREISSNNKQNIS